MRVSTRTCVGQAQVFRMAHVVNVIRMSQEELDAHLLRIAENNPFLVVRRRRHAWIRTGAAHDAPESGPVDAPNSLYDHVLRELSGLIAQGGAMERLIVGLVEELEPTGWIGRPVPEIAAALGFGCEVVESALRLVQRRVSPAGLFARDLADCLRLQLEDQDLLDEEMERVLGHLAILETGGADALARAAALDPATLSKHLARLRRLDPKPGSRFTSDPTLLRDPDVRVEPDGDGWMPVFRPGFETTVDVLPKGSGEGYPELRRAVGEARALKQALELRQNALKHIVRAMIEVQGDFFRDGPVALKPLTQATIAERTGFHLSTVSRVLNGLLIEGPNGIVPARILCARRSSRCAQRGVSKPRVLARLRELLLTESPSSPLSDQCLSDRLGAEGLTVSRRVVANYRQELGFAPVAQRRLRA